MEGPGFDREVTKDKSIKAIWWSMSSDIKKKKKKKHYVVVDDIPVDMINRYKFVNW